MLRENTDLSRRHDTPGRWLRRLRQQGRTEQQGDEQLPGQRDHQQPAHAGGAGMARQPKRAEGRRRRHGAEDHGPHQARLKHGRLAGAPGEHEVDVEGDADAEQQWQGDDVGEVQRQVERRTRAERQEAAQHDGRHGEHDVARATQDGSQQHHNGQKGVSPRLQERIDDALARGRGGDRPAGRLRRHGLDCLCEPAKRGVVVVVLRQDQQPGARIQGRPVGDELARQVLKGDRASLQLVSHLVEHDLERRHHGGRLSDASPLGVPFNNFRKSSAERQRKERIAKNRPGSACYKKFLAFNTEYGGEPICTASRKYQHLKLQELKQNNVEPSQKQIDDLLIKDCLCEGLASPVMLVNNVPVPHNLNAVTICPGPNLAYFSGTFTLQEMINHIYGRANVLNSLYRSHMFVNELKLYIDYLKKDIQKNAATLNDKKEKQLQLFKENLSKGIEYYRHLAVKLKQETKQSIENFKNDLMECELNLKMLQINSPVPAL